MIFHGCDPLTMQTAAQLPARSGAWLFFEPGKTNIFAGQGDDIRAGVLAYFRAGNPVRLHGPTHYAYVECPSQQTLSRQNELIEQYAPVTQTVARLSI